MLAFILVGLAVLLVNPQTIPLPCAAALHFSDDFNDGNYDGWTIMAINTSGGHHINVTGGSFSVDDGALRANGTNVEWNVAHHPSSVAYGT